MDKQFLLACTRYSITSTLLLSLPFSLKKEKVFSLLIFIIIIIIIHHLILFSECYYKSILSSLLDKMANPHVVNVYIHDKDTGMPDPKDLAEKYELDYDPSDDERQDTKQSADDSYDENIISREIAMQTMTNDKIDSLISKLDSKNREIERLCVLLEAVSVVPGADPGKFIDIIDGNGNDVVVCVHTTICPQ